MKIFNRVKRKSILTRTLIPLLCLIILETVITFGVFFVGGLFSTLNQNEIDILNEKTKNRKDILQTEMVRWSSLENSINTINENTAAVLAAYSGADLTDLDARFDAYGGNYTLGEIILRRQSDDLIDILKYSTVNGWMIVLSNKSAGASNHNGIYLRANVTSSGSSSGLMQTVAPLMVRGYLNTKGVTPSSTPDTSFMIDHSEESGNFFTKPYELAESQIFDTIATRDRGYWSHPFKINNKGDEIMTYTMPLIHAGSVYGVAGVSITLDNIKNRLAYQEIDESGRGVYYIGIDAEGAADFERVLFSGPAYTRIYGDKNTLSPVKVRGYDNIYELDKNNLVNGDIYSCVQYMRLYNDSSPFAEESWALFGFLEKDILFSFTNTLRLTLILTGIVVLTVGVVTVIVVSFALSRPISKLTEKVKNAKPEDRVQLDRIDIYEIDQFVEEIERLTADIVEVEQAERNKIKYERDHDGLTHLLNRRAFNNILAELAAKSEEVKTAALVMLDIDNLKYVNDTYGHDYGDAYIKAAANSLRKFEREGVIPARMAGDEFYLIIYGFDSREPINKLIKEIEIDINSTMISLPRDVTLRMHFSGGFAWYPVDADNFELLIKYADFAMYIAKRTGKGKFNEFNLEAYKRDIYLLQCKEDLNKLIDEELVEYFFQPVVSAVTGELYGYEALMRSLLPQLQNLNEIMLLAHNDAKLYKLEELTWIKALENYSKQAPKSDKKLFINTFSSQKISDEIVEKLEKEYPDYLKNIVMELTEGDKNCEEFTAQKRSIAAKWGATIALDGYGTGYNGDSALLSVRPELVTINVDIIRNIDTDIDRKQLIQNLISYAKERNICVLATGVATYAEMRTVIESGVDYLQGNHLCPAQRQLATPSSEIKSQIIELNKK